MSRLPAPSGRQLIAALKHLGFELVARKAATRFCAMQTVAQP